MLIEADHRKVLGALAKHLQSDPGAIAPPRVYDETVAEPLSIPSFALSASRIEKLYSDRVVRIEQPDYSIPQVSDAVDKVRECIAKKTGKPVHKVERADLQIVALATSHAIRGDRVELVFRDKALRDCLELVLVRQRISGVTVTDSSILVRQLLLKR